MGGCGTGAREGGGLSRRFRETETDGRDERKEVQLLDQKRPWAAATVSDGSASIEFATLH